MPSVSSFRAFSAVSPTYNNVIELLLSLRRSVKKSSAFGRTQPFVTVAAVKVAAEIQQDPAGSCPERVRHLLQSALRGRVQVGRGL